MKGQLEMLLPTSEHLDHTHRSNPSPWAGVHVSVHASCLTSPLGTMGSKHGDTTCTVFRWTEMVTKKCFMHNTAHYTAPNASLMQTHTHTSTPKHIVTSHIYWINVAQKLSGYIRIYLVPAEPPFLFLVLFCFFLIRLFKNSLHFGQYRALVESVWLRGKK